MTEIIRKFFYSLVFLSTTSYPVFAQSLTFDWAISLLTEIETDPRLARELNSSKGKRIVIRDFDANRYDKSEWDDGGNLIVTVFIEQARQIRCVVADENWAMEYLQTRQRRSFRLTGIIDGYSRRTGLTIRDCELTNN